MDGFCFDLNDSVSIRASGELGLVIGRAQYTNSADSYMVRYKCADGRAVEQWWSEDALEAAK